MNRFRQKNNLCNIPLPKHLSYIFSPNKLPKIPSN